MIKIDKDIPPPDRTARTIYPFAEMEVGDSFFREGKAAAKAASIYSRGKSVKFQSETRTEGGKKGERVWRIA